MRYTERHCGKAVIKNKELLPEALEMLAKIEESEEGEMDKLTTEMMEHICDNLCMHPRRVFQTEDELENICAECKMGKFVCDILNTYNGLNEFSTKALYETMAKAAGFVRCRNCEYLAHEKSTDAYWCRCSGGLDFNLKLTDGCTRGKEKKRENKSSRQHETSRS